MRNKTRKLLAGIVIFTMMGCLAACGKASLSGDDIIGGKTTQTTARETTTRSTEKTSETDTTADTQSEETTTASADGSGEAYTEPVTEAPTETIPQNPACTVSVTIDGSGFGGNGVLYSGTVSYTGSMSVFDILCMTGVSYSGSSTYVSMIAGMAEKEYGAMSGWKYSVNGVTPGKSCGNYFVSDGDVIYWYYVDQP